MIFNPAVRATGDVVIITRFFLIGKLSVWLNSKAESTALSFLAADPDFTTVGVNYRFRKVQAKASASDLAARPM